MAFAATILTLFPHAFPGVLGVSLCGTALSEGVWTLETVDIREFARNKHRSVDDTPAGGGPGMVLRPDVASTAIDSVDRAGRPLIYLSPRGAPLTQRRVREISQGPGVILFCGRFEGLDQRVIDGRDMEEVSIGDFVLSGGEVAAQALLEACVRLLPGMMGKLESADEESFEGGLLEYPHYTRPREWEGRSIPEPLLSGDHARIRDWRKAQAEELTRKVRPDLWAAFSGRKDRGES